jgi:hypothetical protein
VALEKQYSELVLEHDELVAISEVLKNELQIEKEIVRLPAMLENYTGQAVATHPRLSLTHPGI